MSLAASALTSRASRPRSAKGAGGGRRGRARERVVSVVGRERAAQRGVQAEFGEGGRRRLRGRRGGVQGQVKLGMRLDALGAGDRSGPGAPGRAHPAARGGALAASAITVRGHARTPGTVGHAENSIDGSEVACSTDVQRQRRTADVAALSAATGGQLARGSGGEDRRLEPKTISRFLISHRRPYA